MPHVLGHFEDAQQSQGPQPGEAKRAGPGAEVDPHDLKERAGDDGAVEAVEGGREVGGHAERVQPYQHLEDESAEENKLCIICQK